MGVACRHGALLKSVIIAALTLSLEAITIDQVAPAPPGSSALPLATLATIEEALSETYQHLLVASGHATPPNSGAAPSA